MALQIELNEAVANRRTIHFRAFLSNGTSPDTGLSNDSVIVARGSNTTFIPNALVVAVHAAQGMYSVQLLQSNVSNLGQHAVYYTQGDFPQHVANFEVVNNNPFSTQSNVDSNVSLWRGVAPNALISGRVDANAQVVGDKTGYTILAGTYSNVTFSAGGTAPSLVTLAPGTHSSATVQGVTRTVNLTTNDDKTGYTIAAGAYSNVTFSTGGQVPSSVTLAAGTHSGATVGSLATIATGGIVAASFAANAVDAAALAQDAAREIADEVLDRDLAGGASGSTRNIRNALRYLRNRVDARSSVLTVYQEDDSTAAWTASITTTTDPSNINHIDP